VSKFVAERLKSRRCIRVERTRAGLPRSPHKRRVGKLV